MEKNYSNITYNNDDSARINEKIRASEVRLIDNNGEQVGIVSLKIALSKANSIGMDLVEVASNANPPVCRIMNYDKYKFEQEKNKKQATRNQKKVSVKEIKFRSTTGDADYQVKLRNLIKFIESGDKVKVSLRFRGREISYKNLGMKILDRIEQDLVDIALVESNAKQEGRQLIMIFAPKKR